MEFSPNIDDCERDLSQLETSLDSHIGEPVVVLLGEDAIDSAIVITGTNLGFSGDGAKPLHAFSNEYGRETIYALDEEQVLLGTDEIEAFVAIHMENYAQHDDIRSAVMAMWVANGYPEHYGGLDTALLAEVSEKIRHQVFNRDQAEGVIDALLSAPVAVKEPLIESIEARIRDHIHRLGVAALSDDILAAAYLAALHDYDRSDVTALTRILTL